MSILVNNRRTTLLALLSICWLVIIVSLYFVLHKPFSPEMALNLGRAGGQILVAFGLISVGGGLGAWLLPETEYHPLARLSLQAALGLGILSILVLGVGATLGVNTPLMWLLFFLLAGALWRQVMAWWCTLGGSMKITHCESCLEWTIAFGLGLVMLTTLVTAIAPPLKFDALVYHLTLPRAYLDAGRITYLPWLMYWGMPQISEMLYTWALALAGVEAAVVLGWAVGLLSLAGIFGFISHKLNERSAWVALVALLAGFTTASSLAWGYAGWMTILYGWAFLVLLDRWVSSRNRRALLLAGVFAGLALGTKYTAGILLLCGLGVVAWFDRKEPLAKLLFNLLIFGAAGVIVSSPWWLKNMIATGNPFYPFLSPAGAMNQLRLEFYADQPVWGGWGETAFLPLAATVRGQEGTPGFSASIGPLLLGLGALAWIGRRQRSDSPRSTIKIASFISVIGIIIWAAASRLSGLLIQTRLYLALFPAFAVLAGAGFDGLNQIKIPRLRLGRVAGALVLLVLYLNVFQIGASVLQHNALQTVLSLLTKDEYLLDSLGWFAWALESIDELPESSQVLMLWEPRSYYCTPKCTPDELLDRWYRQIRSRRDEGDILQAWQEEGFTHLLVYQAGADFIRGEDARYSDLDWRRLDHLLASLPAPLEFGGVYALYPLSMP